MRQFGTKVCYMKTMSMAKNETSNMYHIIINTYESYELALKLYFFSKHKSYQISLFNNYDEMLQNKQES